MPGRYYQDNNLALGTPTQARQTTSGSAGFPVASLDIIGKQTVFSDKRETPAPPLHTTGSVNTASQLNQPVVMVRTTSW